MVVGVHGFKDRCSTQTSACSHNTPGMRRQRRGSGQILLRPCAKDATVRVRVDRPNA